MVERWKTETTRRELAKELAVLVTIDTFHKGTTRDKLIAIRNLIEMEKQNQIDEAMERREAPRLVDQRQLHLHVTADEVVEARKRMIASDRRRKGQLPKPEQKQGLREGRYEEEENEDASD